MKRSFALLFVFFIPLFVKAQFIEGTVKDKSNGESIEGAVVVILGARDNTVVYKLTDAKGFYRISLERAPDSLRLQVSLLGYATQVIPIKKGAQKLDVSLQIQDFQLKEVSVKPGYVRLKEDTIAYNVAALQAQSDRNIGDLLRRIPGIEVSKSGGITYQGESINKFYIEGLDLLEQKYGIATNNVPVDAVSTVEVIENHQPVSMLKNMVASTKAAVNIKLKKDRKVRPVGTVDAGTGTDFDDWLRSLSAFGLQVAPQRQTVVMYKTNNRGNDITLEFEDQQTAIINGHLQSVNSLNPVLTASRGMRNPPLTEPRYLFNKSSVLTLNNLWKTGENAQLRMNINYINDRRDETIREISSYYIREDSLLLIEEWNSSVMKNNTLESILTYTENEPGHYFNNTLKGVGRWNDLKSSIETRSAVNQLYDVSNYSVRNDLSYLKKTGNRFWNVNSFVRYSSLPQKLSVHIDTLDWEPYQEIFRSGLYTNTSSSFSYKKGLSTFKADLRLDASFDDLNTSLSHYLVTDTFRNDLHDNYMKALFLPQYTIGNHSLSLSVNADLVYHLLDVDDKLYDETEVYSCFYLNPSVRLNYNPNGRWRFAASYRYSHDIGSIEDFTTAYILPDYKILQTKSGELSKNKSRNFSLRIDYKDPLNGFYFNAFGAYSERTRNLIGSTWFIDKLNVSGNRLQDVNSNSWMGNGYIGKSFYSIGTSISLSVNYNLMHSEKWQQGNHYPFSSSTLAFNPVVNTKINRQISLNYSGQFVNNMQEITTGHAEKNKSSLRQMVQTFKAYYFLNKKIQLKFQSEYFNNEISSEVNSELFFLDLELSYSHKQLEFAFEWNNMLDEKSYSFVTYNGLDSYNYNYKLRPESLFATIRFKY
ncbi:MAG: TonB-dependent receptor [Dysgonamonadaceae bacterium]|jgi:hypothetical protein|nr:TonB-dependent receptor [Dysgonamonadaceae bacterium]